ncbi:Hypothetical protein NTJ_01626 [Nesidiocoris tenuis]|uniref:Uncharacterized protein n=1 Tax=Nesidiocoris tenuis TaxID=355587 RepID=A0ABN7ABW6_9HEMI|nr:Hypothetical protein NTJ_01626 [Nesidiocoris tenuis]
MELHGNCCCCAHVFPRADDCPTAAAEERKNTPERKRELSRDELLSPAHNHSLGSSSHRILVELRKRLAYRD